MPKTYEEMKFSKPERKRTGEYFTCENCKRIFYISRSMLDGRGRFCSRKCQKEFHAVEKICPICGKTFSVPRGVADRYTVCSWECRAHVLHEETCERCGKIFKTHETRWKARYCSEECRRPPVMMNCATCGKEFRALPSDINRQFCSFACYRRSNGETNLEKVVRQSLEVFGVEFIQEAKMGRYSIDFYFPAHSIALEVDGDYWHQDKKRDQSKDKYLAKHGINTIRISESEINAVGADNAILSHLSHHINLGLLTR